MKYTIDVTYGIVCGTEFDVEASSDKEAKAKVEEIVSNTNMMDHMIEGNITDMEVTKAE